VFRRFVVLMTVLTLALWASGLGTERVCLAVGPSTQLGPLRFAAPDSVGGQQVRKLAARRESQAGVVFSGSEAVGAPGAVPPGSYVLMVSGGEELGRGVAGEDGSFRISLSRLPAAGKSAFVAYAPTPIPAYGWERMGYGPPQVWSLIQTPWGEVWASGYGYPARAMRYVGNGQWEQLPQNDDTAYAGGIWQLTVSPKDGNVYAISRDGARPRDVYRWTGSGWQHLNFPASSKPYVFTCGPDGRLWAINVDPMACYFWDGSSWHYAFDRWNPPAGSGWPVPTDYSSLVGAVQVAPDGTVYAKWDSWSGKGVTAWKDGTGWWLGPYPGLGYGPQLAVDAVGGVYAGGSAGVYHWTGSSWVPLPVPGAYSQGVLALLAASDGSLFAFLPDYLNPSSDPLSLRAARYDGTAWTILPPFPLASRSDNTGYSAVCQVGDAIWFASSSEQG